MAIPFKLRSGNKPTFKNMGATKAIKQVDTKKAAKGKGSEREIYKAKLRGDYMDLTGDKLKKASYDDYPEELIKGYSIPESPTKQVTDPKKKKLKAEHNKPSQLAIKSISSSLSKDLQKMRTIKKVADRNKKRYPHLKDNIDKAAEEIRQDYFKEKKKKSSAKQKKNK
tara:strand:- start:184 stop:687 length:504 start_codon:yes stop_codon:yes gene_type:complete